MREGSTASLEPNLRKIVSTLRSARTPYMVIGALALTAWGQPRGTMDFDIMIAGNAIPERLVHKLSKAGFQIDKDWAQHNPMIRNLQTRFRSSRIALDILIARDAHDRAAFARRKRRRFNGYYLWFPSPEDFLLQKIKVGRPQDFSDAAGIVQRCLGKLDQRYLARWATKLAITAELRHVTRME
jgi:hypothetical protein